MSYVVLSRRPVAGLGGALDEVTVNADGTVSLPGLGLRNLDLTNPSQFAAAKAHVDVIIAALPAGLSAAGGTWQADVVGVVKALARGDIKAVAEAGVRTALAAGGTAACAATGVGAAVAPMCGTAAAMLTPVVMKVGEAVVDGVGQMLGMKSSAQKKREKLGEAAIKAGQEFVAAKERALVGLAKLEQAIADQTNYAAAAAFARLRNIEPTVTTQTILAKMQRDAGGAFDPDAPRDPDTGFSARQIAAQEASKALYDQVMKSKAGGEFLLRAFATIGPTIAKRYQYPGPTGLLSWWTNMPPDVWRTSLMSKDLPLDVNTSKLGPDGKPMRCRLRNFVEDDPANGWAGAAVGKTYGYAYPNGFEPNKWGWKASLLDDADAVTTEIQNWNIRRGGEKSQREGWGWFNNPGYVRARLDEQWNKRVDCQISAHADAFRAACQYQLGELARQIIADEMRLRLAALRDEQVKRKQAKAQVDANLAQAKEAAAREAEAAAREAAAREAAAREAEGKSKEMRSGSAPSSGGGSGLMLLLGGVVVVGGGAALLMKSKKK